MSIKVVPPPGLWPISTTRTSRSSSGSFSHRGRSRKSLRNTASRIPPCASVSIGLIQKFRVSDATEADPYVALIKRLAADERIDFTAAKVLIKEYRKQGKGGV